MPYSFLAIGPKVEVGPLTIRARTSTLMAVLTLGAWRDEVNVNSRARTVTIRRRRFWVFVSERTVPFAQVQEVAYSMIDGSVGSFLSGERDGPETFDLALTLYDGEEVPLLRFTGDGEYVADVSLPFERLGDRLTEAYDARGDQQERSLGLAELLCARLGVPLGGSRYF